MCRARPHVVIINPAATVRAERYQVVEGKTPEISAKQARRLLESIETSNLVGLRDRAVIAILIYTAARVGAIARLTLKSLMHDGSQYTLRLGSHGRFRCVTMSSSSSSHTYKVLGFRTVPCSAPPSQGRRSSPGTP